MNIFKSKLKSWEDFIVYSKDTNIDSIGERAKERLIFMGITKETLDYVHEAAEILQQHIPQLVDSFYEPITITPHLQETISKHSTMERLRGTMEKYVQQLLSAQVDREYIKTRITIGQVHSRIHLTAEHFISAHHLLIQMMTIILMKELHNRPKKMIHLVHSIQKLAAYDQQLIVEVYMETTFKKFLFDMSEMLNSVTELDTTRKLMDEMDEMMQGSHNVTSAAEQVSSSIMEVANHSTKVAEKTEQAVQSASESKEIIAKTLYDIDQVGQVYKQAIKHMEQLNYDINQTYEIINVIQKITEQTNLLALNASIEAARAGDQGKGFAVVAAEVRKLAEHTKEQTSQITENMEYLKKDSKIVKVQMDETLKLVTKSIDGATYANHALEGIISTMEEINGSTGQIAAMTQEQTAAVIEIAERNAEILEFSANSQKTAKDAAIIILDLSKKMNNYRLSFLQQNIQLSDKDIIEIAKTDHLLWKWKIYNVLMGIEQLESLAISSYTNCRLGTWYYGKASERMKKHAAFKELEIPHKEVHDFAQQANKLYQNGQINEAFEVFYKLEVASSRVVDLLEQLKIYA